MNVFVVHSRACPHCVRLLRRFEEENTERLLHEQVPDASVTYLEVSDPRRQTQAALTRLPPFATVPQIYVVSGGTTLALREDERSAPRLIAAVRRVAAQRRRLLRLRPKAPSKSSSS